MPEPARRMFRNFSWHIPEEQFDLASAALLSFPFLGISEESDKLIVCFDEADVGPGTRAAIEEAFGAYGVEARFDAEEQVEERNWNAEWESSIEAVRVSERIVIVPEWRRGETDADISIVVSPKMSFGTGHHETTRLVAAMMETLVEPDSFWIDAGTGTGVLAILAVKLGARRVFAFDNDEWSYLNAGENIGLNGVADAVELAQADVFTADLPPADGIVANLHKNLLIPNYERFIAALKDKRGYLLVSGILRFDVEDCIAAALARGLVHRETRIEGDWAAVLFGTA